MHTAGKRQTLMLMLMVCKISIGEYCCKRWQWRWDSLKKKEAQQSICEVQRGEVDKQSARTVRHSAKASTYSWACMSAPMSLKAAINNSGCAVHATRRSDVQADDAIVCSPVSRLSGRLDRGRDQKCLFLLRSTSESSTSRSVASMTG